MPKNPNKTVFTRADVAEKFHEMFNSPDDKMNKSKAATYTNGFFRVLSDLITEAAVGDDIKLGDFGVLTVKMTKGGERRNPKTQEMVQTKPKKVIKFRTLPKFKGVLNEEA